MQLEIHDTTGDDNLFPNRAVQYLNADVFMICVPVAMQDDHNEEKFSEFDYRESIAKWRNEIYGVHQDRPIYLVLTKMDLLKNDDVYIDNPVTVEKLIELKVQNGFQDVLETSSKLWQDFNVHMAFTKAIVGALKK